MSGPSGKSIKSNNNREQRVRRWLERLPEAVEDAQIDAIRDEEPHTLTVAPGFRRDTTAAAEYLCAALQDEADAVGSLVRGRVAAQLPSGKWVEITVRCSPGADADVLPGGTFDPSTEGQIAQLQKFVEGMVTLSLRERHETYLSMKACMDSQAQMLTKFIERWETEAATADELRKAVQDLGGDEAPAWVGQALEMLPKVAMAVGGAIARRPQAPPQRPHGPPPVDDVVEGEPVE